MTTQLVANFVNFAPLGTVLVALLGVGIAEHSGLISAVIRLLILGAPKLLVTAALVFAGVVSNTASEIGYVVVVPLGAAIFYSLGRHPYAGLAAAFAGVSGGYSANLLLGTVDPLLSGITSKAAAGFDPRFDDFPISPACNLYFMIGSTFLVTIIGTFVSTKLVEPRLGEYSADNADDSLLADSNSAIQRLTPIEFRGLVVTGWATVAMVFGLLYLCVPLDFYQIQLGLDRETMESVPLMGALGDSVGKQSTPAFLQGVVGIIFVGFLIPGLVYGWVTGTVRSDQDVIKFMGKSMSSMGLYIVITFFAAQFIEYFNWSNLGVVLAIIGADLIAYLNLDNPSIFLFFIFLCAAVNLVMGSASAKWTFLAPIFVPMLMRIGYSPELTQLAYRIGDSCTNVISPMMTYFGMIFVFACKYDKNFKLGTLISLMFPYSVVFLIFWTLFFFLWVFLFELPIGPSAPIYYQADSLTSEISTLRQENC